ncbi:hypothetical protein [Ktedonobacter racemifer]|nr:hypothetical protein [Ktedonobacter racemifer]
MNESSALRQTLLTRLGHFPEKVAPDAIFGPSMLCNLVPHPFLLTTEEYDSLFPIDGVRSRSEQAQRIYAKQGVPERFRALIFPSGHSFPSEVKAEAYAFLDQWLKPIGSATGHLRLES